MPDYTSISQAMGRGIQDVVEEYDRRHLRGPNFNRNYPIPQASGGGAGIDSYVLLQQLHAKGWAYGVLLGDDAQPTGSPVILQDFTKRSGHYEIGQVVLVPHGSASVIGGDCQTQET
jgi:hypothetical protein